MLLATLWATTLDRVIYLPCKPPLDVARASATWVDVEAAGGVGGSVRKPRRPPGWLACERGVQRWLGGELAKREQGVLRAGVVDRVEGRDSGGEGVRAGE